MVVGWAEQLVDLMARGLEEELEQWSELVLAHVTGLVLVLHSAENLVEELGHAMERALEHGLVGRWGVESEEVWVGE